MGMIQNLAFSPMLGLPAIAIGGMFVGLLLLATLCMGLMISSGKGNFTMNQHKIIAIITVLLAIGHGIVGILGYLGY